MASVLQFLADAPVLLAFFLIGLGMFFGHIKAKGVSLGAAAVLFVAIIISAWAQAYGIEARVPGEIGTLGLAMFAFAIGITSGPSFFRNIKSALGPILAVIVVYLVAAGVAYVVGTQLFGLDIATIAGTFAGATTNTPALAAAGEASGDAAAATVGYSIAYIYGVLGSMIVVMVALKAGKNDTDVPSVVTHVTIRVERTDQPTVAQLLDSIASPVTFSRVRRGESGPIWIPELSEKFEKDDLVTIISTKEGIKEVERELGHISSHSLRQDRRFLDFRRITVSNAKATGKTVAEINAVIEERFGGTVSRIRRGDVDQAATPDFLVEMGDRVRVVAPTAKMKDLSAFFGDSSRGLTDINPVVLGLGLVLGILIGEATIPTPGGGFSIGSAAGTLIVGLILGKLGRIGSVTTTLPHSSSQVLSELGLLLFLAQAGTNAGGQIAGAFTGGTWWQIAVLGAVVTTIVGFGVYFSIRLIFHMGGTKLSGFVGGVQTQPAVLAFANNRTATDPRVALGYALIYPVAMIGKILVAQILGSM